MYRVTFISGGNTSIGSVLKQAIDTINNEGGLVLNMLQSQSSTTEGFAIISITILWRKA